MGDYRLEAVVGQGGMGIVYRAQQLSLDRPVALKLLGPSVADDAQFQARFRRESHVATSIDHPNVIPVYDAGEWEGLLYMAMKYVEGKDLRAVIAEEGRLDPERAAYIVGQVAAALDAAHAVGLVHRDVKPGNVLLASQDHVYLTDFGLAKHGRSAGAELTQTGMFVGTLDFVSPEQIRADALDARSDQYGLGCVLYNALTGQPPYSRESDVALLYAHLFDPPPLPSAVVPELAAFDPVIERSMAKDPSWRYPTAGDLGRAALAASQGLPAPDVVPSVAPELGAGAPAATTVFAAAAAEAEPEPEQWEPSPDATVVAPSPPAPAPVQPASSPWPPADFAEAMEDLVPRRQPVVSFPLRGDFRYVHHPLAKDETVIPLLGNERVVERLVERILHSSGGSFLVTGFRGVGKTTVILRALESLAARTEGPAVLPVFLNVARPRSTEELLFEVIRRLFEALVDKGVLGALHPEAQRQLILAYTRTSLSFKETREKAVERSRALSLSPTVPMLEALAPKLELSNKSTDSLATEAAFLAYSDADVEHDFVRIVSLFRSTFEAEPPERSWWQRMVGEQPEESPPQSWDGKVVIVIDEVDKLTAREDGIANIEALLSGLKNLLTIRGVHFLFVAGTDLHDITIRDRHRGNSVYDSVFGWQLYVPCTWKATDKLLDAVLAENTPRSPQLQAFRDYLRFKGRGVPRLLLMELNDFVEWDDGNPRLTLAQPQLARVQFYAGLERVLTDFLKEGAGRPLSLDIDRDRWRVGAYYVTDWILRSRGSTFTVEDIVQSRSELSVDPSLVLAPSKVEQLIEHLVKNEIVERAHGRSANETFYGDVPGAQASAYRLSRHVGVKLASFARSHEGERGDLVAASAQEAPAAKQPWAESDAAGVVGGERYELRVEVDRGGMGRVYRAYDRLLDREVALKMLDVPGLVEDDLMRARFLRKGRLARELDHPNIVSTYETFEEPDGRLGIVMEFVEGPSLRQLLEQAQLERSDALRIALGLADALDYLSGRGIARLDLKPTSILCGPGVRPVIIDLGLAKRVTEPEPPPGDGRAATVAGAVLGTPAYAAPEQLAGKPADIRADVYSLGLLLYEMLSGRRARGDGDWQPVLKRAREEDIDLSDLKVSDQLRGVLARMVARDPAARFATPAEARAALETTPEAEALRPTSPGTRFVREDKRVATRSGEQPPPP